MALMKPVLGDAIFQLIGIDDGKEELFEVYLDWCSKISKTDILRNEKTLHEYAEEMYNVLLMERG